MKIIKRILLVLAFLVLVVLISGLVFIRYIAHKGVPEYDTDVQLSGMKGPVTVYRDSFAVPHIYAQNEEDLYRAVGYVMAQDRLWQMDLIRRVTQGRLSEIFGEDYVETDHFLRSLRITEKSARVLEKTSKEIQIAMEAFSDGVNQFIEQHLHTLPVEFSVLQYNPEKWESGHSVNIVGYMAWDLAGGAYTSELLIHKLIRTFGNERYKDLIPDVGSMSSLVYPGYKWDTLTTNLHAEFIRQTRRLESLGVEIFRGSNNWAVSGEKTVTGKPLLANDMHLGFGIPGIWYQMHHVIEGRLNVTGVVIPGEPFVVAGHNDSIAWGMTNIAVDDIDLYLEKINPENRDEYMVNDEWRKMKIQNERIQIKGGKLEERILRFTHRGPVVSDFKPLSEVISMRWGGNDFSNEVRSVYLLNRAGNWGDFKNAICTFQAVSQNIIYADVQGNIGMYAAGGIPIRKGNGYSILPGNTDEFDWTGKVPFEELPHSYNPGSGIVASANNKTAGNDYPYYIGTYFSKSYRIDRIRELLEEKDKLSVEDFKEMQMDQKSMLVRKMKPVMINLLSNMKDLNEAEKTALEILSNWDNMLSKDSPAPLIFEQMYMEMVKNFLKDDMGQEIFDEYFGNGILVRSFVEKIWENPSLTWCDDINTPEKEESFSDIIHASFRETIEFLSIRYGSDPFLWNWGEVHQLILEHPLGKVRILDFLFRLNKGPFPVGGSYHTVSPYIYSFRDPYRITWGASQRHIYSTADWDNSFSIIPTGGCGLPTSDFYCDQSEMYVNGLYRADYTSKNKVINSSLFKMTISAK